MLSHSTANSSSSASYDTFRSTENLKRNTSRPENVLTPPEIALQVMGNRRGKTLAMRNEASALKIERSLNRELQKQVNAMQKQTQEMQEKIRKLEQELSASSHSSSSFFSSSSSSSSSSHLAEQMDSVVFRN